MAETAESQVGSSKLQIVRSGLLLSGKCSCPFLVWFEGIQNKQWDFIQGGGSWGSDYSLIHLSVVLQTKVLGSPLQAGSYSIFHLPPQSDHRGL